MAYKFFTKDLLKKSSEIDLASIFPEKQQNAKARLNTNYSLPEIVDWIRTNTNDFKKSENYFIDLDQAIRRLVFKYYESTSKPNPFITDVEEVEASAQPRVPAEVTSGVKSTKSEKVEEVKEEIKQEAVALTSESVNEAMESLRVLIELEPENTSYKEALESMEILLTTL